MPAALCHVAAGGCWQCAFSRGETEAGAGTRPHRALPGRLASGSKSTAERPSERSLFFLPSRIYSNLSLQKTS